MAKATETQKTSPLIVENGNWGATSLRAIHGVVESAYAVLVEAFEKKPEDIIHVTPWNQEYPLVVHDRRPYRMYLSARDTYWSHYAYQFSHELCHILTNFDRAKQHRHEWFEESLCEVSSLFTLHRLAEVWAENPPEGVLKAADFAPYHREYAKYIEAKYDASSGVDIPDLLAQNTRTPGEAPAQSELTDAATLSLLDYFLNDLSLWSECGWLNHWDSGKDATFSDYLDSWSDCLSRNGRENRVPNLAKRLFCHDDKKEPSETL